jgi:hypothetical protein
MGKFYDTLPQNLIDFIAAQKMFFIATAPVDDGRVNLSPKGYESVAVLDPSHLLYVDYAGSGNETANHIAAGPRGRVTFMWCSYDEKPLILRVYGHGRLIERHDAAYARLIAMHFPAVDASHARRLIDVEIECAQTSCGFGVPRYQFISHRPMLAEWSAGHAAKGTLEAYIEKNRSRVEQKHPLRTLK